ncbi:MAG: 4-alpha-glucanotransferase, partial [Clostridia bacterium]|nr:4-alpha-glucanotransferase [Clostridia bacterium]
MSRASGVLMHISSLYGDYSIGSFGKNAKEFVDFIAECGFSYWQTLPFNMADECGSPYKSYGSFSGNPYFVDIEKLAEKGLITESELGFAKQDTPYACEFERLEKERFELLKKASSRVCKEDREKIERVISAKKPIYDFCLFMALKEANGYSEWIDWTKTDYNADTLFAWEFIEYEFLVQWSEIKAYANSKGIKIIGDIPIYVAYDSSDVWANKNEFRLDAKGHLKAVAGVPPDYFAKDGQLWGNPLYNWNAMKKNGYKWWCERMEYMLELFDGV